MFGFEGRAGAGNKNLIRHADEQRLVAALSSIPRARRGKRFQRTRQVQRGEVVETRNPMTRGVGNSGLKSTSALVAKLVSGSRTGNEAFGRGGIEFISFTSRNATTAGKTARAVWIFFENLWNR